MACSLHRQRHPEADVVNCKQAANEHIRRSQLFRTKANRVPSRQSPDNSDRNVLPKEGLCKSMNRSEDWSLLAMALEATTFRAWLRNLAGCLRHLVVSRAMASRRRSSRRAGLSCKPAWRNTLRPFFGNDPGDGTWLAFSFPTCSRDCGMRRPFRGWQLPRFSSLFDRFTGPRA